MAVQKSFFSRIPRFVYIILGILAILIIAATIVSLRLKPFVSNKIKTGVTESTRGLYIADFTDLHLNLLTGTISFDSLKIRIDKDVLKKRISESTAPKHLFELNIKGLAFRNVSLWDVYRKKQLLMGSIVIARPQIHVSYFSKNKTTTERKDQSAYELLSKTLKSLQVKEIILNEAALRYTDVDEKGAKPLLMSGLNIRVADLLIDSASQHDKTRLYYTRDIQMNLKDHSFRTADSLYIISVKELTASTARRNLRLTGLKVAPRYPEMEFSKKYTTQHDRYDLNFREILLAHLDVERLNTQRTLAAGNLVIDGAIVNIFMNRELPPVSFDKGRNYPHVVIRRLKLNTIIDSLQIKNTRISYSEYNPKSKRTGTVVFDRFNALLRNVSNDSLQLQKDHWMRANVSAWLMNKGKMDVNVNMDLTAPNANFNFNGVVGRFDMRGLNALSRNMSLAEIESGVIRKAEFKVNGDLRTTTGYLKLYYQDLKVNVLKNDENSNKLEKRGLLSALANTLIIKNDNPDRDGQLRIGKTNAQRINSASFFYLMWKSIFEGLKESVGFTLGKAETQQTTSVDKKQQRKQDREKRRAERKEKREAKQQKSPDN